METNLLSCTSDRVLRLGVLVHVRFDVTPFRKGRSSIQLETPCFFPPRFDSYGPETLIDSTVVSFLCSPHPSVVRVG